MRMLLATFSAAPHLILVLRADPAAGHCFLWLAPSGSTGRALEAPALPAGVAQLSAAAVAAHSRKSV
jgi:hypothetical protein